MTSARRLLHTTVRRARRRAWSRAGAIAVVLGSGTPRRVLTLGSRIALLVAGAALISVSVAVTLWNGLGPGPLDVFIGAVREITGLPLSVAVWATVGSLTGAAWLLGRPPGPGTLAAPILIGPLLQGSAELLSRVDVPDSDVVRVLSQFVAIVGIGVGAGALIVSGLGAGSGELFAGAASERVHRPETRVRPVIELTWIVVGTILGGPAGVGTVLVALFIGPSVAHGHRFVDGLAARSVRGLSSTHEAIVAREADAVERELELSHR